MGSIHLEDVKRLRLEEGDVLVLHATSSDLDEAEIDALRDQMETVFPDHRTAVLAGDLDLQVVATDERGSTEAALAKALRALVEGVEGERSPRWLGHLPWDVREVYEPLVRAGRAALEASGGCGGKKSGDQSP